MFNNPFIKILRPHQWIKNLFLFIPLVFSENFKTLDKVIEVLVAFFSFCLIASAMYVFNDLKDIESDRSHPKKQFRPLARGDISKFSAIILACFLASLSILLGFFLDSDFLIILMIYIILNLFYSNWLKHIPVIDIVLLASFYIVRIFTGAVAINVEVSSWLLLTSFFAALFLGSGKRYVEFVSSNAASRRVLKSYSKKFLLYCLQLSSFCTILFYTLYASTRSFEFQLSSIFVVIGFMNYFYLLYKEKLDEDPVITLVKTNSIRLLLFCWLIYVIWILYF